jgi:hypothetical protein
MNLPFTVTSTSKTRVAVLTFAEDAEALSLEATYSGRPGHYRPVSLEVAYIDDRPPDYTLFVRKILKDGRAGQGSHLRRHYLPGRVQAVLDEIARKTDPR